MESLLLMCFSGSGGTLVLSVKLLQRRQCVLCRNLMETWGLLCCDELCSVQKLSDAVVKSVQIAGKHAFSDQSL